MALKVADNFDYQGKQPNFKRDTFDTLADMKAYPDTSIDEGHISLCLENGKRYKFSKSYSIDDTTGRWRRIVDTALDITSENPVQNNVVASKFNAIEQEIAVKISALTETATTQYEELLETIGELNYIVASLGSDLSVRIDEDGLVLAQVLNDLENRKLNKTTLINGHEIGDELNITKSDIGLGKVDNTSDADKPISTATTTALNGKVDKKTGYSLVLDTMIEKLINLPTAAQTSAQIGSVNDSLTTHREDKNNPHKVTAIQVGLGAYSDYTPTTMPVSEAMQTALNAKANVSTTINGHSLADSFELSKSDIGLGNVDNTSDIDKPISTATQEALDEKADESLTAAGLVDLRDMLLEDERVITAALTELRTRISALESRDYGEETLVSDEE